MDKKLLEQYFEKSPVPYITQQIILDETGVACDFKCTTVNKAFEDVFGLTATAVIGRTFTEIFPESSAPKNHWLNLWKDASLNNKIISADINDSLPHRQQHIVLFPFDDHYFALAFIPEKKPLSFDDGITCFIQTNLTMLCVADTAGNFVKVNNEFETVLGYTTAELEGTPFISLVHANDRDATWQAMQSLREKKPALGFINRYRSRDGSYKYIEWRSESNGNYIFSAARDITAAMQREKDLQQLNKDLQKTNETLKVRAITDELTGLYNRYFFDQKIGETMARADRYGEPLSLISFDLDRFKRVNDTFGHPIGDDVLKQTAKIAGKQIRSSDLLIRFGGEEFLILLPQTCRSRAATVAEKIRKALADALHPVAGQVTASFGVAERNKAESFKSWYTRTDEALYQAKDFGRNQVVTCSRNEQTVASVRIDWLDEWSCGEPEIDQQHKDILEIAQGLIALSLQPQLDDAHILNQLDRLFKHILYHFNYEIKVLLEVDYPQTQEHTLIHQQLLVQAAKLKERYQQGELKASAFFAFIIDDLVLGHVLKEDILFFPYTKKQNDTPCSNP